MWIHTLEEFDLKDDIIACQRAVIQILQRQYARDIKNLRKDSIEAHSKQYYEKKLYTDQKNRNFFERFIEQFMQVHTYCVVVLDIDRFKTINDTFGHAIGDEAIQHIATQLLDWCPHHNIHIIRYGGDEFIMLMPYALREMSPYINQLHHQLLTNSCDINNGHSISAKCEHRCVL